MIEISLGSTPKTVWTMPRSIDPNISNLLQIAREIIEKIPMCFAITVDQNGEANAPVVHPAARFRRRDIRQFSRTQIKFYAHLIYFIRAMCALAAIIAHRSGANADRSPGEGRVMRNARPTRWIAQAEARRVLTISRSEQRPTSSRDSVASQLIPGFRSWLAARYPMVGRFRRRGAR
jgi:hypothetical protein